MSYHIPQPVRNALAPNGKIVAAINYGNPVLAQKDAMTGEPRGITADLARELARRLGTELEFTTYVTAGLVAKDAPAGRWTVGFLAIDPERAEEIIFTAPYVQIEGTYMVPKNSPLRRVEDVDRKGVRIALGSKTAYDLYLTRTIQHAELVHFPTSEEAWERFLSDGLDAAASIRQPLVEFAGSHPGLRVMSGRFMAIRQAMALPQRASAASGYISDFIEEMKTSGFVAESLRRSGQDDTPPT